MNLTKIKELIQKHISDCKNSSNDLNLEQFIKDQFLCKQVQSSNNSYIPSQPIHDDYLSLNIKRKLKTFCDRMNQLDKQTFNSILESNILSRMLDSIASLIYRIISNHYMKEANFRVTLRKEFNSLAEQILEDRKVIGIEDQQCIK